MEDEKKFGVISREQDVFSLKKLKKTDSEKNAERDVFSKNDVSAKKLDDLGMVDWHLKVVENVDEIISRDENGDLSGSTNNIGSTTPLRLKDVIEIRGPFERKPKKPDFITERGTEDGLKLDYSSGISQVTTLRAGDVAAAESKPKHVFLSAKTQKTKVEKNKKMVKDDKSKKNREKQVSGNKRKISFFSGKPSGSTGKTDEKKPGKKEGKFSLFIKKPKEEEKKTSDQSLDDDVIKVLQITDDLLGKLPDDVINDFALSEDFKIYEKVFERYNIKRK